MKYLTLTILGAVAFLLAACELPDTPARTGDKTNTPAKPATPSTPTKPGTTSTNAVVKASLTGTWLYKNEFMKLRQSGTSVQGSTSVNNFKQNPADPVEYPVPTVGSVSESGVVKLSEVLTYPKSPAKNSKIDKVGRLKNADTLVLDVVKGQAPQTQTWTRKK